MEAGVAVEGGTLQDERRFSKMEGGVAMESAEK